MGRENLIISDVVRKEFWEDVGYCRSSITPSSTVNTSGYSPAVGDVFATNGSGYAIPATSGCTVTGIMLKSSADLLGDWVYLAKGPALVNSDLLNYGTSLASTGSTPVNPQLVALNIELITAGTQWLI